MISNPTISKLAVKRKAFTDLPLPVILASGELGIYYVNTEKLLGDDGEWKKHGDNSQAMVEHAIRVMREDPEFEEVIEILAEKVESLFPEEGFWTAISGGQRRDWIFSGPVAEKLGLGHISLYKDGKIEVLRPSKSGYGINTQITDFSDTMVINVSDLMTKGSSSYNPKKSPPTGWVPMLRGGGAAVTDLVTVVNRLQGGDEILEEVGVKTHSSVFIDSDFLKEHSTDPERALAYNANSREWSEAYLRENGAVSLVDFFDPEGGKLDKARNFMVEYSCLFTWLWQINRIRRGNSRQIWSTTIRNRWCYEG